MRLETVFGSDSDSRRNYSAGGVAARSMTSSRGYSIRQFASATRPAKLMPSTVFDLHYDVTGNCRVRLRFGC